MRCVLTCPGSLCSFRGRNPERKTQNHITTLLFSDSHTSRRRNNILLALLYPVLFALVIGMYVLVVRIAYVIAAHWTVKRFVLAAEFVQHPTETPDEALAFIKGTADEAAAYFMRLVTRCQLLILLTLFFSGPLLQWLVTRDPELTVRRNLVASVFVFCVVIGISRMGTHFRKYLHPHKIAKMRGRNCWQMLRTYASS